MNDLELITGEGGLEITCQSHVHCNSTCNNILDDLICTKKTTNRSLLFYKSILCSRSSQEKSSLDFVDQHLYCDIEEIKFKFMSIQLMHSSVTIIHK